MSLGNRAMVSAARRPARAGFDKAKLRTIKMATAKIRPVACNAPAVWCEFVRGFISVPFEKRVDFFIISFASFERPDYFPGVPAGLKSSLSPAKQIPGP